MTTSQNDTPNNKTKSHKETVLEWLRDYAPAETFGLSEVAEDLADQMTKQQVNTALHGLAEHGLEDRLVNVAKGLWRYRPVFDPVQSTALREAFSAQTTAFATSYRYRWPDEVPREVPLGYRATFTVVAKRYISNSWEYVILSDDGTVFRAEPVFEVQSTQPAPSDTLNQTPPS